MSTTSKKHKPSTPFQADGHYIAFAAKRHNNFVALVPAIHVRKRSTARARTYIRHADKHGLKPSCTRCGVQLSVHTHETSSGSSLYVSGLGTGKRCTECTLFCQERHAGRSEARVREVKSEDFPGRTELLVQLPTYLPTARAEGRTKRTASKADQGTRGDDFPGQVRQKFRAVAAQMLVLAGADRFRLECDRSGKGFFDALRVQISKRVINKAFAERIMAVPSFDSDPNQPQLRELAQWRPGDRQRTRVVPVIGKVVSAPTDRHTLGHQIQIEGVNEPIFIGPHLRRAMRTSDRAAYFRLKSNVDTHVIAAALVFINAAGALEAHHIDLFLTSLHYVLVDSRHEARLANWMALSGINYNKPHYWRKRRRRGDYICDFRIVGQRVVLLIEVAGRLDDPEYVEVLHRKGKYYEELEAKSLRRRGRPVRHLVWDTTSRKQPSLPIAAIRRKLLP